MWGLGGMERVETVVRLYWKQNNNNNKKTAKQSKGLVWKTNACREQSPLRFLANITTNCPKV